MAYRTDKQIEKEIKRLQKERQTLPEKSFFGDNNWEIIDEEIEYLQAYIDGTKDDDDMEKELQEREERDGCDAVAECGLKHALDFIQGY